MLKIDGQLNNEANPPKEPLRGDPDATTDAFVSVLNGMATEIHAQATVEIVDLCTERANIRKTIRFVRFGYTEMQVGNRYIDQLCEKLPPFFRAKIGELVYDGKFLLGYVIEFSVLKDLLIKFIKSAKDADMGFLARIKGLLPVRPPRYKKIEAINDGHPSRLRGGDSLAIKYEPPPPPPTVEGWSEACLVPERTENDAYPSTKLLDPIRTRSREEIGAFLRTKSGA